jgi:hypothetical protein
MSPVLPDPPNSRSRCVQKYAKSTVNISKLSTTSEKAKCSNGISLDHVFFCRLTSALLTLAAPFLLQLTLPKGAA